MKACKGHLITDIFQYREDLIGDYSAYVKGFLEVRDADVEQFITSHLDGGLLDFRRRRRDSLFQGSPIS
jgi:hypothetical protein